MTELVYCLTHYFFVAITLLYYYIDPISTIIFCLFSVYIYVYNKYIYNIIYIYIHINLPVNAIVRQHHPRSGDSRGQEKFLPSSADKQTCNYDTRVLKTPFLPIKPKVRGIEP